MQDYHVGAVDAFSRCFGMIILHFVDLIRLEEINISFMIKVKLTDSISSKSDIRWKRRVSDETADCLIEV
jgi:hypothetical protein